MKTVKILILLHYIGSFCKCQRFPAQFVQQSTEIIQTFRAVFDELMVLKVPKVGLNLGQLYIFFDPIVPD